MAKAKKSETAAASESAAPAPKKAAAAKKDAAPKKEAVKKEAAAAKKPAAPAAEKKPAAKGGKSAAKPAGDPLQAPMVDTGLAAQTAAAMIANRVTGGAASSTKPESASFKNFKDSLNKPAAGGLGGILGTGAGSQKFGGNFGGPKNFGGAGGNRNQTFGADVNRAGVPRRTSGG